MKKEGFLMILEGDYIIIFQGGEFKIIL